MNKLIPLIVVDVQKSFLDDIPFSGLTLVVDQPWHPPMVAGEDRFELYGIGQEAPQPRIEETVKSLLNAGITSITLEDRVGQPSASAMKFYKSRIGVVGVQPGHQDGEYTFLLNRTLGYTWIRTADLYDTREEAERAPVVRCFG